MYNDDIAQRNEKQVIGIAAEADGGIEGSQHADGEDGHIGDAVFKPAGKEGVETPEYHDEFGHIVFRAEAAPDSQTDEDITEDARFVQRTVAGPAGLGRFPAR